MIALLVLLATEPRLTFGVPSLGVVRAVVPERPGHEDGRRRVLFESSSGASLGDFTFDIRGSASQVDLRVLPDSGRGPIVLAVAHMPGADGVRIQAALFGPKEGRIRPLLPLVVSLEAEDGMCVGDLGLHETTGVAAIRAVFGGECFLCWPKKFEALVFQWEGTRLKYLETLRTHGRHPSWKEASYEMGLHCQDEITPTVFPANGPQ
jgi:hypothetical protein